MKNHLLGFLAILCNSTVLSQTWTGNTSTEWDTGTNWSGNTVPAVAANVIIPTAPAGNRWPKLGSNTTVATLTMQAGAQMDVGGFTFTANSIDIRGVMNNTNMATDIVFTLLGSATSFVRNCTFNDHITFNLNGTGVFYDNYLPGTANTYNGHASFVRNGTGATYVGFYARNSYAGNVTMSNTVASVLDAFEAGGDVQGSLSFTTIGGTAEIGDLGANTTIQGTITVNASVTSNIGIYRVTNLTNGGSILINNRGVVNLERDTLKVSNIQIGNVGAGSSITNNSIVGNIDYSTAAGNTSTIFVRSNLVTGNASYILNGTGTFYDTYLANTANSYSGNVSYTRNSGGATYVGFYSRNSYGGNVTMSNTVASVLDAFEAGGDVQGNLSFTSVGGTAEIGELPVNTTIQGTITVNASITSNIGIYRVTNLTNGGSITINNRGIVNLERDTLQVSNIQIGSVGAGSSITNNSIVGNIDYSTAASNTSTIFVRSNVITGNTNYTLNGSGTFYDNYLANTGNYYNGHVSYTRTGNGPLYVGYYDTTFYSGNLLFNYNTGAATDNRYIGFIGSTPSSLSQNGNAPLQFYGLVMQKAEGGAVTLLDSVRIVNNVAFGGGNLMTSNENELIFLNGATTSGATDDSKAIGPVVKIGAQAFTFPIGSDTHLQSIGISVPSGATTRFRAQYYPTSPHPIYDTAQRAAGLARISTCSYWQLLREIGTTNVTVTLPYGTPCPCVEQPADLRMVRWSGSQWQNLGNGGTIGSGGTGTLQSGAGVAEYGIFTLASSALVAPAITIVSNVPNPVCLCRKVTFTATPVLAGCNPIYQWKKNNVNVGANLPTYEDSTLAQGDIVTCQITSSAAFAQPAAVVSNSINISTTDLNTWAGTTSNNWHEPANWSCMSVPCNLTKVTIPGTTPFPCHILQGNVQVISLTGNTNSAFKIENGATLTLKPL